ncbi:MAG: hypothetical protein Q4D04_14680, partial [Clostridia bacterium]|nr:hypothetical protein [Clostridia bacterium]
MDAALESLMKSGLIARDTDSLVVDSQAARIMRALCARLWTIRVDTMNGTHMCIACETMCMLAERMANARWLFTPVKTSAAAIKLLRESLDGVKADCDVRLSHAGRNMLVHTKIDVLVNELSRRCAGDANAKGGE